MKRSLGLTQGMTLVALIAALSLLQGYFFRTTLELMNNRSTQIIAQMMGKLLEHTHRLNDDLTMQSAMQGLSQGAGVVVAAVLDNEKKVIANANPSLLGQTLELNLKRSPLASGLIMPLKETNQTWGYFVLVLSRRMLYQKMNEQVGMLVGANVLLGLGIFWFWLYWKIQYGQVLTQYCELQQQSEELKTTYKELQEEYQLLIDISTQQILSALELVPQAAMYLDSAQRMVGFNKPADELLKLQTKSFASNCSWQDIPLLENCGEALQQSMVTPGQKIVVQSAVAPIAIYFLSQKAHGDRHAGTWVFFS